jgi:hypothetical protein
VSSRGNSLRWPIRAGESLATSSTDWAYSERSLRSTRDAACPNGIQASSVTRLIQIARASMRQT